MKPPELQNLARDLPLVSVVVPCFRERERILVLLDGIRFQTYPLDRLEVVVADGLSDDGTREILTKYTADHPELKVVVRDNAQRIIPAALNIAIRASTGDILVRMDGHSRPSQDYIATCVEMLRQGAGDMVGGVWSVKPAGEGWMKRSIAAAASHPAGVGDAHYRWATEPREVDTIAFWAFRREWIETVGYFDEGLQSNEDYDFNSRFRKAGGKIWLDPRIACDYFARPDLWSLAQQYLRYGFWKARMAVVNPSTLRWRQLLPPSALLGMAILLVGLFAARGFAVPLAIAMGCYAAVLVGSSIECAWKRKDPLLVVGVPVAIATMHLCWASAFLWSLATYPFRKAR